MKKLEREDLQDSIIQEIKRHIYKNELKPGDSLPSQQKMAELLGASRTSIREAMKTMEALGLVRVINGKGIFVEQIDNSFYEGEKNNSYRLKMLMEAFYVRRALEGAAIEAAAKIASDKELEELSDILKMVEEKYYKHEDQAELDLMFHKRILELSGNNLLIHMTSNLIWRSSGLWSLSDDEADILNDSIPSHRTVMDYMLERNYKKALEAHFTYIDRILERLEELLKETRENEKDFKVN